jgi:chitin synthase
MQGSVQDRMQYLTQANGWRNGTDYVMGHRCIWLTYSAWKAAEDTLRDKEKASNPADDEESIAPQDDEMQPPSRSFHRNPFSDSDDNLLVNRVGADGSKFQDPNNPYSAGYPNSPYLQTPGVSKDGDSVWGSEYDKKRDLSPVQSDAALEKATGFTTKETQGNNAIEEVPTSRTRRWWLRLVWFCTWWIPSFLLSWIGRMKRPDVRLAWREKVTICMLILGLCGTVIFYIVIFGRLICPNFDKAWTIQEVNGHTGDDDFWVALHGQVYDLSSFWRRDHSDITNSPVTSDVMQALAGQDLTGYFPPPLVLACPDLVTDETIKLQYRNFTPEFPGALHVSGFQQPFGSSALRDPQWYTKQFLPTLRQWHKGPLVVPTKEVHTAGVNGSRCVYTSAD